MAYNKIDASFGFRIAAWMIHDLGLKGAERDVYAVVYSYTDDGNWKQLELSFLAEMTGTSIKSCQRAIAALLEKGLIEKRNIIGHWGERCLFLAHRPTLSTDVTEVGQNVQGGRSKCPTPLVKMTNPLGQNDHHKLDINKIKTNKKSKTEFSTIKGAHAPSAPCPSCGADSLHDFQDFYYCHSCSASFKVRAV